MKATAWHHQCASRPHVGGAVPAGAAQRRRGGGGGGGAAVVAAAAPSRGADRAAEEPTTVAECTDDARRPTTRRRALAASAAALAVSAALGASAPAARAAAVDDSAASASASAVDTTVTDTLYIEFGLADSAFKAPGERTLGDRTIIPEPTTTLGRLEIGLYGNACPATARNALALARSGALRGTVVSRISPGEYVQLARQGSRRVGEVEGVDALLAPNTDLSSPAGFKLAHARPGTVSLSIAADNDEDPSVRERAGYRPVEFLITTGPGPVPRLDGLNLVFGRVTSGMTTLAAVAAVPSFQPDARSQQLNAFAKFIGDDRADKVRRRYGRPLKAVVVTAAGVVGEPEPEPPKRGEASPEARWRRELADGGIVPGV